MMTAKELLQQTEALLMMNDHITLEKASATQLHNAISTAAMIALSYLEPVLDFLRELEALGDLQGDTLGILLKAVGIGLVSEIAGMVCSDAGNGSLGKTLQMLGSAAILYLSLPVFSALLELVREILREI